MHSKLRHFFPLCSNHSDKPVAIASGNWGCGAFGGDPQLKSLIQLMAAAECGRQLAYFTFGDVRLRDDLADLHEFLVEREVNVAMLFDIICGYRKVVQGTAAGKPKMGLFDYVRTLVDSYGIETDEEMETGDVDMEDASSRNGDERGEDVDGREDKVDATGPEAIEREVANAEERDISCQEASKSNGERVRDEIEEVAVQNVEIKRPSSAGGLAKMEAASKSREASPRRSSPSPKRGKNATSEEKSNNPTPRRSPRRSKDAPVDPAQAKITSYFAAK